MDKMSRFCTSIRTAMACYFTMTPEEQAMAMFYTERKARALSAVRAAENCPGGEMAGELLQNLQQPPSGD